MSFIQWNAKVELAGAKEKFIGLGWGLEDDLHSGVKNYKVKIRVWVPEEATARLVKATPNEDTKIDTDKALTCGPNGIEVKVTYEVTPTTGTGKKVLWKIAWFAAEGQGPGNGVAEGSGDIIKTITAHTTNDKNVMVPGVCP